MSSSVYYKFKSQKEPSRVPFDGNEISVFDLKREIISINKLGTGADFDLAIYDPESNEEYGDDTVLIPRSTTVVARRLPPRRPGHGSAARYVSGKMPIQANAARREKFATPRYPHNKTASTGTSSGSALGLEDDSTKAFFAASGEQWKQTQEQMAKYACTKVDSLTRSQTPIFRPNQKVLKNVPVPDHPPPSGYICYRCGEKGHWIQLCPTNLDPNFDGKTRIVRTTGIPRSMLRSVAKPEEGEGGTVMVNAEGDFVVAVADEAKWQDYQQRQAKNGGGRAEPTDPELACSICHLLLELAVRTPCCQRGCCEDCIQNALLESDFICPFCGAQDILLDRVTVDEDLRKRVDDYAAKEKGLEQTMEQGSESPENGQAGTPASGKEPSPLKRRAEEPLPANTPKKVASQSVDSPAQSEVRTDQPNGESGANSAAMNDFDPMAGMPMMPGPFPMMPPMMQMMMMQQMMQPGVAPANSNQFAPQAPSAEQAEYYQKYGYFPTQQLNYMNSQGGGSDDGAYMRRPVNPARAVKQNKYRSSDYREL